MRFLSMFASSSGSCPLSVCEFADLCDWFSWYQTTMFLVPRYQLACCGFDDAAQESVTPSKMHRGV